MLGELLWILIGVAVLGGSAFSQKGKMRSYERKSKKDPYSLNYYKYDLRKQFNLRLDCITDQEKIFRLLGREVPLNTKDEKNAAIKEILEKQGIEWCDEEECRRVQNKRYAELAKQRKRGGRYWR